MFTSGPYGHKQKKKRERTNPASKLETNLNLVSETILDIFTQFDKTISEEEFSFSYTCIFTNYFLLKFHSFLKQCFSFYENKVHQLMSARASLEVFGKKTLYS